DQLLPTHADKRRVGAARQLVATAVALPVVAAVETGADSGAEASCLGAVPGARSTERREWAWSMVECWCVPHESGAPRRLLHAHGAGLVAAHAAATPVCSLNRRMRN